MQPIQQQGIVRTMNVQGSNPTNSIPSSTRQSTLFNDLKSTFEQWANSYTKVKMAEIGVRLMHYHQQHKG